MTVVVAKPGTLVHELPLSVETCQTTLGFGVPLASAVNVRVSPACPLWFSGLVVTSA